MSSLLAYGQGFLAEDIGSGAGLTEPWAQTFGWGDGGGSSLDQDADLGGYQNSGEGGLSQFFSVIQAGASREGLEAPKVLTRSSTRRELHWDSPPQSPSTPFVYLPSSLLQIVATGTKADAVVIGLFQNASENTVETFLSLPKGLSFAEYLVFKPDMLAAVTGKMVSTDELDLPVEFSEALGARPQAFLAEYFICLGKYKAIVFGLWRDFASVPATAQAVFSDAVKALPTLLSHRINVPKYERLGRRFDAILKVMPDAVVFVDDECAQVIINPAAASLLGLPYHGEVDPSKIAVAMRKLTERCSNRTDPKHWMGLLSSSGEQEIEEDWELKMPRRVLHVRSYPVTSHIAHGRLWIYEDVTAERDAEEAMEAANRAKSQFLAMMSHELRTPMTGVLGMLDLLHMTKLGLEQQGLVKIMQESANGLMEVINNILDYCKIEAGRLQLEEIDFSLVDMFEQVQTILEKSFLVKDLKVTICREPGGRNVVRGDPVRLRQVLLNLVSNAIKFTEQGSVNVSWRFLDPQWVDTTVVATSQAPSGRSRLKNQIINASRGEKCSVEHLSSQSGRSVVIIHCSSAGVAGPYLESSITSSRSSGSSLLLSQTQRASSSMEDIVSGLPRQGTGRPSFPVSYSLGPQRRPTTEALESVETIHSFNERKNIIVKESFPTLSTTMGDPVSQPSARTHEEQNPFSQRPLVRDPVSSFEENEFRASKYQRLSVEVPLSIGKSTSLVDGNLEGHPKCHRTADSHPTPTIQLSNLVSNPVTANYGKVVTSMATRMEQQSTSVLDPRQSDINLSRETKDKFSSINASKVEDSRASSSSSVKICNVCGGVLYTLNDRVEEKIKTDVKPEDKVWLEVTISDTGVGIGKEQLHGLFVGSHAGSQRRNAAGTGLGLAICKGLLCLMNGKLQIDSKIGEGTTVILTVPLLPAEEAVEVLVKSASSVVVQSAATPELHHSDPFVVEVKATTSEAEIKQIKVLVAEDNKVNQLLIRKMFRHFGHEVEVVGNGKLAVEAVQQTAFDLVLMDVQMPILDGLSATKAIRALPPPISKLPIYALSADAPGSGPMEETGLDGYLKKPIAWEMVSQLVAEILAAKK